MVAYDANRDVMRARQADWHQEYTWKAIWKYFQAQRGGHGSYRYEWSTANEAERKRNDIRWQQILKDSTKLGWSVCAVDDSSFVYTIYGTAQIGEPAILK